MSQRPLESNAAPEDSQLIRIMERDNTRKKCPYVPIWSQQRGRRSVLRSAEFLASAGEFAAPPLPPQRHQIAGSDGSAGPKHLQLLHFEEYHPENHSPTSQLNRIFHCSSPPRCSNGWRSSNTAAAAVSGVTVMMIAQTLGEKVVHGCQARINSHYRQQRRCRPPMIRRVLIWPHWHT